MNKVKIEDEIKKLHYEIEKIRNDICNKETQLNMLKYKLAELYEKEKVLNELNNQQLNKENNMATFKFNGKIDDQLDECREFVKGLKKINKVKMVVEAYGKATMQEICDITSKISGILPEDVEIDFKTIVDDNLKENETVTTLDFE